MIEFKETIIRNLIFHKISNIEKDNYLNSELFTFTNDEEEMVLKKIFLKPFLTSATTYEFKHDIDLELNVLYKLSTSIYEEENFVDISKNIHQHLKSVSKHPNIKDGELFIVQYSDVKMGNVFYDAVGIYKIENKDSFLEIQSNKLILKKGISSRKLDKACLILFTKKPYTIFVIDNGIIETDYWKNEFIKAGCKNDNINNTSQVLSLTKDFITQQLPQQFEVSKADQVDFLNKSVKFFKEKDCFNMDEFANEVIVQPEIIESFNQYKSSYQQNFDIDIADEFLISESAVKKQARAFKSVIKLDKNFHIYVHGDRHLIEQGEDKKGKFYKVYYQEES